MSSSSMVKPIAILLLAVAVAPRLAVGSSSVINATCAALKPLQPYDYRVGVLSADPAAAAATDVRGVAAAAVNITAVKAASTLRVITYLVDELTTCRGYYITMVKSLADARIDIGAGRLENASLTTCRGYYITMVKSLADARIDIGAGRLENASLEISANASGVPMGCDILLFEGNAHKDPISEENGENDLLTRLAKAIIDLLIYK